MNDPVLSSNFPHYVDTINAIERVSLKRYQRFLTQVSEKEASLLVASYLQHLEEVHKGKALVVQFIQSLKEAYRVNLSSTTF